ncbi:MAG: phosphatidylglycerol lysyltransferase domain-containing protein [Anaerolineaceae bacterium]
MKKPGVAGVSHRRFVAAAVLVVGLLDVLLAAKRHPVLRVGPLHDIFHFAVVHGSRYLLLFGALALLASARGLLHGKRQALHVAVGASVATLVAHGFKRVDLAGMGVTVGLLVLLLGSSRYFPARSDPMRSRQGLAWIVLGEFGVFLYGVVGLYLLDANFRAPTEPAESVLQAFQLLLLQPASTIEPVTRHGEWFVDSVRVMALVVLGIGIWHLLHPVVHRLGAGRAERARVHSLLETYAANSLAYFHLLEDKAYYLAEDGESFIGYKVVGSTAVVLGEPVGEPGSCRAITASFARFCDLNGWSFCFHQVTPDGAMLLQDCGLTALKLGEEAIIPVEQFSLGGKSFKHLRNATNRLEREGYRFELITQPITDEDLRELEEVSNAWLADGNHRERTFSLGAFSREYMRATELAVIRTPAGRVDAFANLIPSFRSTSGNFDLMRRRPDSADGVMDLLFVNLITLFRERGYDGMNLGFAPLANIEGSGLVPRALRLISERGGRAFNFAGLRAFKDKWHPVWEPRYLVFRSELQLPALALAVARAGEIRRNRPLGVSSIPGVVRRYPFSIGIATIVIGFQVITIFWPALHDSGIAHLGLNWPALKRGEIYRVLTSLLIQPSSGIAGPFGVLGILGVPLAERLAGTKVTAAVFFFGDAFATVAILAGLRIVDVAGFKDTSTWTDRLDVGSSSAVLATLALIGIAAPRRWGLPLLGFLAAALVLRLALVGHFADYQHALSAVIGALLAMVLLLMAPARPH